jgi:hypothetical protein
MTEKLLKDTKAFTEAVIGTTSSLPVASLLTAS